MKKIIISILALVLSSVFVLAADVTPTAKAVVKKAKVKKVAVVVETPTVQAEVVATTVPTPEATAVAGLSFDDCLKLATENNRDFKIASLDKSIGEAQLSKAASSFGPTVAMVGAYQPSPNSLNPYNYMAQLTLSQTIFTFGKTVFGYEMAQEGYKIAQINFKKAGEKLNLDVINSFYGALIAEEMAKTMNETMKSNEEYLRITKTKYANGQASNFDVLQAQVQYANSIPDAQRAQDNAKLAGQMLKNTIGVPFDQEIKLSGSAEYKKLETTYADMQKQFKEKNDDKELIQAATNIAGLNRNLQAAMLLPNFALSANYIYGSKNAAFHSESAYWMGSWTVSVGMQWTMFDSFKNVAAIKEACASAEKAELNKENVDNLLTIQFDQLYTSLDQNAKVIEAAGDLIKTAEEGYRIAKESYKNGLIQSVDLLNAETGLLRAKMNYLNAMFNYITTAQKLKDFLN